MFLTNITSFVFNLVIFSFFAIWISTKILQAKVEAGKNLRKDKIYNWFTWLGIFAILAQLSYVYAPKRIFSNAEHHVIEHLGYSFDKSIDLVNESDLKKAIWDDKKGELKLIENKGVFLLRGSNFYEPIFVKKEKYYQLSNAVNGTPITKQLDIRLSDSLGLSLFIGEKEGLYTIKTYVNQETFGPFVVPISQPLNTGYAMNSMLNKLPSDAPNMSDLILALDDVLLVREKYRGNKKEYGDNPLLFFPSAAFIQANPIVKIDGNIVGFKQNNQFEIPLTSSSPFYVGLWNSQIRTYQPNIRNGVAELLLTFPNKKYLKKLEKEQETLFLTSSSDEIANSDLVSGFYYPVMENDTNENHFSSTLTYKQGSTIEKMNFKVVNLDQNDLDNTQAQLNYVAGDTIQLKTKGFVEGKSTNQWLFRIKDLKADNPLQFWHLLAFSALIILMIFISIYLTPYPEQSKTEYIIYILVLTLMTIRSVLLWRVSTFVPTEDVSENIYNSLTTVMFGNFKNGVYGTIIFFLLIWLWKKFGNIIFKKLNEDSTTKIYSVTDYLMLGLYAIAFAVKSLNISQLERIGAVYLPIVCYVFIEFWLLRKLHQNKQSSVLNKSYRTLAVINWFICFGYLALSDAGFSIVFFIATLIYWLLQLLTFPDYLSNTNQSGWFSKLKHWRFLVPIIILVAFIFTAPYLISFIFLKTTLFLLVLSVGLICTAVFVFFKSNNLSFPVKSVFSIGLIAFAAATFIFKDKINEKIQDKGYVRYRAEVLFKTPDEIIQDESFAFNLGNDSKLLRAAQNQWFINYYYENGITGWYRPFLELAKGNYFQILPSFQKGSPYLTQISDLVSVRYVIGEHSQLIIINLLGLILILIRSTIDKEMPFNFYSKLRVLIVCLLFTVAFFIWMAATNRIIFLGQDFPLLSLNSILTLLFTFTILFFVILFGKQAHKQEYVSGFNPFGQKVFRHVLRWVLVGAIALIALRKHDFSDKRFNLDTTIESLREDFVSLNENFAGFQQENTKNYKSLPELLVAFDTYIKSQGVNTFKTEFSKSAYEAYLKVLSKNNNPQNLVHIKRGSDGIYEFAINKLFYDVTSPDLAKDSWRGHLVSIENPNVIGLKNRKTNAQISIESNKIYNDLQKNLDEKNLYEFSENRNIRLTVVPATWTQDSLPKILISTTFGQQKSNRSTFTIKNDGEIIRSETTPFAVTLQPNDVVQFISDGKNLPTTLQYKHQSKLYLAKNVWLNGKNQFFYPLKYKFIWSYHFANLVKSKFDGDLASQKQDLALTIDPILTKQIYDQANSFYKTRIWTKKENKIESKRAFNLVVLDSDGKIKALSDFKQDVPLKFDPNQVSEYREKLDKIYLNSDTDSERLLFGNRCLMRSDNGPASTFKPILYAAVTSQFNFDWGNLEFGALDKNVSFVNSTDGGNSYVVKKFGGKNVKFFLDSYTLDKHNSIQFISTSTNSYNSMITFLGSLDKGEMSTLKKYVRGLSNDDAFLKRGFPEDVEKSFPNFLINNQSHYINRFPSTWNNEQSLLAKGLWENFNFPIRPEQLNQQEGQNLQNIAYDLDSVDFAKSKSSFKLWSFPEPSHLYLIDRNNLHNAIVQVASGADPINTTPLKMAEMAGSLFSFNKTFKASVLANSQKKYTPLRADNSWSSAEELATFYSKNLFKGMNEALFGENGTAVNLVGKFLTKEYPSYHFYAKTGTISGNRDGGKRDKHLMLIISKNKLHNDDISSKDLRNNHFYVLYFSFYKQSGNGGWGNAPATIQNMVKTVIESNSFQTFINHE